MSFGPERSSALYFTRSLAFSHFSASERARRAASARALGGLKLLRGAVALSAGLAPLGVLLG